MDLDDSYISLEVTSEDGEETIECVAHKAHFLGEKVPYWDRKEAQEFDYGYALTVHKAQGSQWGSVLVFDESSKFRQHRRNWLYTAVTRAADKVVVAQRFYEG